MIIALLICLAAIVLAFVFEVIFALFYSWIVIRMDQWLWTFVFWAIIGLAGCAAGIIPTRPPLPGHWIAFFFIAFLHLNMNIFQPHVLTFRRRFRDEALDDWRNPNDNVTGRSEQSSTSRQEDLYYEDNERND